MGDPVSNGGVNSAINRRSMLIGSMTSAMVAMSRSAFAQGGAVSQSGTVDTNAGKVRGLVQDGIQVFLGIPYADPPTGPHRFQPPRPRTPWTGVRDAVAYGPEAPQTFLELTPEQYGVFAGASDIQQSSEAGSLVLNVWTPAINDGGRRPVMIFFHGGGFAVGSGRSGWYDGRNLARKHDVVVLTVNHRLNTLGYLYLAHLSERFADSGNAGTLDLVAALQWIKDNIAGFGGDPANVTIFGESGGGAKVCTLMGVAPAKGLFHRAIAQSGPGRGVAREAAIRTTSAVMRDLGIPESQPERLLDVPPYLLAAALEGSKANGGLPDRRAIGPVIDGRSLPFDPFSTEGLKIGSEVPLIIGTNRDESAFLLAGDPKIFDLTQADMNMRLGFMVGAATPQIVAAYRKAMPKASNSDIYIRITSDQFMRRGSQEIALLKARAGGAPAYLYLFEKTTPVNRGLFRSPHALEIPYVFDNLARARAMTGPGSQRLADQMSATWTSFARKGRPDNPLIPRWEAVDDRLPTIIFGDQTRVALDPDAQTRKAWGAIPPIAL